MKFLEIFFQTLLAFTAILIYTRILGKQQVGQLTFFEYINGITFGSIAAVMATDLDSDSTLIHFYRADPFRFLHLAGQLRAHVESAREKTAGRRAHHSHP